MLSVAPEWGKNLTLDKMSNGQIYLLYYIERQIVIRVYP